MTDIIVSELTSTEYALMQQQNLIQRITDNVQVHMDMTVKSRGYDNLLSACTYAASNNTKFKAEGLACTQWRDDVWSFCYQLMSDVIQGIRPLPTEDEIITMLPTLNW